MSDDDDYWLHFLLKLICVLLAVAFVFAVGLVLGAAFLLSGLAE